MGPLLVFGCGAVAFSLGMVIRMRIITGLKLSLCFCLVSVVAFAADLSWLGQTHVFTSTNNTIYQAVLIVAASMAAFAGALLLRTLQAIEGSTRYKLSGRIIRSSGTNKVEG